MKKTFLTNLALLVFLNLLVKPFWIFGIDRTVQNTVGAHEYGLYAAMFSLSIMLNIILDLGITNFNNRNIAQHSQLLRKYFSNIVILKCLLGVVYAIIAIIVGALLNFTLERYYLFIFLIFNQFLLSFILYLRSNISGLHKYKTDSLVSVIDRVLMIILCGIVLITKQHEFKIQWFVYAQTISYSITCAIAFIIVYTNTSLFRIKFDFTFLLVILKQSYPFALLVLLMGLYTRMDMVMVEYMLPNGAEQAGIYAQSYRILDAVSMFAYLFATLLLPMFSKMLRFGESVAQLTKLSFILLIIPTLIFVICTWFYGWELMKLMYHDHYDESAEIYKVLIIGFIPISSSYIFGTLLTANNSLKYLNIIAASGMVLNFILNIICIPYYGAYGAALASVITQYLTAIIQILLSKRIFHFTVQYKTIILLLVFTALTIGMCFYLKGVLSENWIYNMILLMIFSIIIAFSIRLIRIKDLVGIVKYDI
ncbi:MAG TPA: polysaccharide biosynthesis C-terminal domain-containing protein [Bacteroidales bacterium]|nr:polysaccharide biosynthesis C-terminal domain-containing protein [Bacteroidales bacterium]